MAWTGRCHHVGWFLPGPWTLTPGAPPAGYLADGEHTVAIATTAVEAQQQTPFAVQLLLDPVPAVPSAAAATAWWSPARRGIPIRWWAPARRGIRIRW